MNGTSTSVSSVGAGRQPEPIRFQPESSSLPEALHPDSFADEPLVLLVDASPDSAWAAETAIAIAGAWSRGGRRVVLADLHLHAPVLDHQLGLEKAEGIVDIFLYGASVAHSARPAPGQGYFVISAGTPTADPEQVYRHDRWSRLVAGFAEAGATLLAFVPGDAPGIESLTQWAGSAILLGVPAAEGDSPFAGLKVPAVLVPAHGEERDSSGAAPRAAGSAPGHRVDDAVAAPQEAERHAAPAAVPDEPSTLASQDTPPVADSEPNVPGSVYPLHDSESSQDSRWPDADRPEPDDRLGISVVPKSAATADSTDDRRDEPASAAEGARRVEVGAGPEDGSKERFLLDAPPRRKRRFGAGPLIWLLGIALVLIVSLLIVAAFRPDLIESIRSLYDRGGTVAPAPTTATEPTVGPVAAPVIAPAGGPEAGAPGAGPLEEADAPDADALPTDTDPVPPQ
jgi:hypothetical protein